MGKKKRRGLSGGSGRLSNFPGCSTQVYRDKVGGKKMGGGKKAFVGSC